MSAPDTTTRPSLSIVTTCLNEADNLDEFVSRTLAVLDRVNTVSRIIIVDDGSTDATWERITEWMRRNGRIRAVRRATNGGIVSGWRSALDVCDTELVCLLDADLQNRPEDIGRLYEQWLVAGRDIVQGVRKPTNPPKIRLGLSRGLNHLLNAVFGMSLADNKSGFILCRIDTLREILKHRFRYRHYQCFLAVAAHRREYSIAQVDTPFMPRMRGHSFVKAIPFVCVLRILWEIAKARVEFRGKPGSRIANEGPKLSKWGAQTPLFTDSNSPCR